MTVSSGLLFFFTCRCDMFEVAALQSTLNTHILSVCLIWNTMINGRVFM